MSFLKEICGDECVEVRARRFGHWSASSHRLLSPWPVPMEIHRITGPHHWSTEPLTQSQSGRILLTCHHSSTSLPLWTDISPDPLRLQEQVFGAPPSVVLLLMLGRRRLSPLLLHKTGAGWGDLKVSWLPWVLSWREA